MSDHDWEAIATEIVRLIEANDTLIDDIKRVLSDAGVGPDDVPAYGLVYRDRACDIFSDVRGPDARKSIVKFGVTAICPRPTAESEQPTG